MAKQKTSDYCRSEAARLRELAEAGGYAPMRAELLKIAEEYEALAVHFESAKD